jgi:hypothetical protein
VYISRDVVFDETVFPFASLHSNAGARLRAEINLLPLHLQPSLLHGHEERVLQANTDDNPTVTIPAESADFSVPGYVSTDFSGSGTRTDADSGDSQSALAQSPLGSRASGAQDPSVPGADPPCLWVCARHGAPALACFAPWRFSPVAVG